MDPRIETVKGQRAVERQPCEVMGWGGWADAQPPLFVLRVGSRRRGPRPGCVLRGEGILGPAHETEKIVR